VKGLRNPHCERPKCIGKRFSPIGCSISQFVPPRLWSCAFPHHLACLSGKTLWIKQLLYISSRAWVCESVVPQLSLVPPCTRRAPGANLPSGTAAMDTAMCGFSSSIYYIIKTTNNQLWGLISVKLRCLNGLDLPWTTSDTFAISCETYTSWTLDRHVCNLQDGLLDMHVCNIHI
jgi:hypothetical protein